MYSSFVRCKSIKLIKNDKYELKQFKIKKLLYNIILTRLIFIGHYIHYQLEYFINNCMSRGHYFM